MRKLERELTKSISNPLIDLSLHSSQISSEAVDTRPHRPTQMQMKEKWELRSVVAVFRHGDRTPKQKMKMTTKDPCFLKFFEGKPNLKKEVKLKTPREL
jgi:hypothetical protein